MYRVARSSLKLDGNSVTAGKLTRYFEKYDAMPVRCAAAVFRPGSSGQSEHVASQLMLEAPWSSDEREGGHERRSSESRTS